MNRIKKYWPQLVLTFSILLMCGVPLADTLNDLVFVPSGGGSVIGMNASGNLIQKYNRFTGAEVANAAMNGTPASGTYEPTNDRIWVSAVGSIDEYNSNTVSVLDPANLTILNTYATNCDGPGGIAKSRKNNTMWISCNHEIPGKVVEMDLGGNILRTITVNPYPGLIIEDSSQDYMWVGNYDPWHPDDCSANNTQISKINVTSGDVTTYTADNGVGCGCYALAEDPVNQKIYLAAYNDNALNVFDMAAGNVVANVTDITRPNDLEYSYLDGNVYSLSCCCGTAGRYIYKIDTSTYAKTATTVLGGANSAYDYLAHIVWGTCAADGAQSKYPVVKPVITRYVGLNKVVNSNYKLYLAFNESNAAFTDYSLQNSTLTNNGVTYSASGKFGGAGVFDGSHDMSIPYNASLNIGTGTFKITWWHKGSVAGYNTLIGQNPGSTILMHLYNTGVLYWGSNSGYVNSADLGIATLTDGNYHYIEVGRLANGYVCMSIDGTMKNVAPNPIPDAGYPTCSYDNYLNYTWGSGTDITIGSQNGVNYYQGTVDDLQIIVGEEPHTENFTPPVIPSNYESVKVFNNIAY